MTTIADRTTAARTAQPIRPTVSAVSGLRPLDSGAARVTGGFWADRQERNGRDAIRSGYRQLEAAGNFENLRIAAGLATGEAIGPIFMDSDVYKWLEAVAWEYGRAPAGELLDLQREVTALVAAAQEEDGYVDSVHAIRYGVDRRYHDLTWSHELYCAGHLFQAAVAQSRATGDTALLEVAVRLADHLVRTFGDDGLREIDGHPVVETGLVELYRETGTRAYLDLARWFVDAHGRGIIAGHGKEPAYFSDRVPAREAETVEGHAVRAVYLAAGATDVAVETEDAELLAALERQFAAMLASKTYITGGLGARWEGEAFGDPYELPSDRGYAETCAAIGGIQWAQRLLLATGKPEYAAAVERILYNAFLAGVSLAGTEYFYVNPLQVREDADTDSYKAPARGRRSWFACACCPPNIHRTFASLDAYVATCTPGGLQLQQLISGEYATEAGAVRVESGLPSAGDVRVTVTAATDDWSLGIRIPDWSDATAVSVDGRAFEEPVRTGAMLELSGLAVGTVVELRLDMTPRVFSADDRVDSGRSSVAVERGPLVYAVESADQPGVSIDDVRVRADESIDETPSADLVGVVELRIPAADSAPRPAAAWPYRRLDRIPPTAVETTEEQDALVAIPYYAWGNRTRGPMRVWLPVHD